MFFDDEAVRWEDFSEHELQLAEDAFELFSDDIASARKPKAFFISGILLTNFVGYEDASDELKDAIASEVVHQWELGHPEQARNGGNPELNA